jgi:hypothetical protein
VANCTGAWLSKRAIKFPSLLLCCDRNRRLKVIAPGLGAHSSCSAIGLRALGGLREAVYGLTLLPPSSVLSSVAATSMSLPRSPGATLPSDTLSRHGSSHSGTRDNANSQVQPDTRSALQGPCFISRRNRRVFSRRANLRALPAKTSGTSRFARRRKFDIGASFAS